MLTPLHTEIDDPVERLHAIHQGTIDAKAALDRLGPRTLTEIPMNLPAPLARNLFPLLGEVAVQTRALTFNTMITNVAGIQKPLYLAGAKMTHVMGVGPVIDQSGLFHAVFSYNGVVSVAFTACRDMIPDADHYASCIEASYNDLEAAALEGAAPLKRRTKRKGRGSTTTARKKPASKSAGSRARKTAKKKPRKKPVDAGRSKASKATKREAARRRKTRKAG